MTPSDQPAWELADLISELRRNGYNISMQQHIAAQRLLVTLAARGDWLADSDRLGAMLAAVLCTSRDEQKYFPPIYNQWLKSSPGLFKTARKVEELETPSGLGKSPEKKPERSLPVSRVKWWLWPVTLTVAVAIIIAILSLLPPKPLIQPWRVIDSNGQPISQAGIEIHEGAGNKVRAQAETDDAGVCPISAFRGDRLEFSKSGYHPATRFVGSKGSQLVTLIEDTDPPIRLEPDPLPLPLLERLWLLSRDNPTWAGASVAAIILLCAGLAWLRQLSRKMELKKWRTQNNPRLDHLVVQGAAEELTRMLSLRRTAQKLRCHRQNAAQDLHIEKTIEATIRQEGFFTPVYTSRKSLPEYLVLIDRTGFNDQNARLVNEVLKRLGKHDVFIERYFFQGDPRICRKDDPQAPFQTLENLAAQYPESYLLVFSDGAGFFNLLTGRPQRWLEMFSLWPSRVLLTSEIQAGDYREWELVESGFRVLPAGQAGLTALSEMINVGLPHRGQNGSHINPLPVILQQRPERWLESHPPPPNILNEMCRELKRFLGQDGYYWLSACAVYPMLYWDLTLYIGYALVRQGTIAEGIIDEKFSSVVRLPWFRNGSMPDWLRERLILELSPEQEQSIRDALEALLLTALLKPEGLILPIVREPQAVESSLPKRVWHFLSAKTDAQKKRELLLDVLKSEAEEDQLRDYVLVSFMSGRKPDRLGLTLPDELRHALYPKERLDQGRRWARVLIGANLIVAAGLLILLWGLSNLSSFIISASGIVLGTVLNVSALRHVVKTAGVANPEVKPYAVSKTFPQPDGRARQTVGGISQPSNASGRHSQATGDTIEFDHDLPDITRHPRGLYVLFVADMWERFAFYSMLALFTLYLQNPTQGFGWTASQATSLYSWYLMFVYTSPLVGGFLADFLLGYRRSVMIGGLIFLAGYLALTLHSLAAVYTALGLLVVGNGLFKPNISMMVGNLYPEGSHLKDRAYNIFYMGINIGAWVAPIVMELSMVRVGYGPAFAIAAFGMVISVSILWKFKRHIEVQGEAPRPANAVAEAADSHSLEKTHQTAIDTVPDRKRIGALIVTFLIVTVFWMAFHQNGSTLTYWADDNTNWNVSGIVSNAINPFWIIMLTFPLVWFWKWLDRRGKEPSTPMKMVIGMFLTGLSFIILFFAAKTGESMFVQRDTLAAGPFRITERSLDYLRGEGVPVEILDKLQAVSADGAQIVKDKKFASDDRGTAEQKLMEALRAVLNPQEVEQYREPILRRAYVFRVSPLWLIMAYMVISLGELMLSPMGLSLVSKVAPIKVRGLMMGGWFVATALGNKLTAIGVFWSVWNQSTFFILLGSMAIVMAVVLLILLRPLKKSMPGV